MAKKAIGEYNCPNCGRVEILKVEKITLIFPRGAGKPKASVECEQCGAEFTGAIDWSDAMIFDKAGANVDGFSFARGPVITELEIEDFMSDFNTQIKEFLDASRNSR